MATSRISQAQAEVKIPCDLCDSLHNVKSFCKDCSCSICENCLKAHHRLHKKHTVVPVFEGILEKHYIVKCANHKEKFKFFCQKCRVNICEECITSDHMGHQVEKVNVHAKRLKQTFTYEIGVKKTQATKIREHLDILKQHEFDVKSQAKTQADAVRSETVKRKKLLDEDEQNIVKSINQEEKTAIDKLRTQYKQLQNLDSEINTFIEAVNNELYRVPDTALLQFVNDNESKMATILTNLDFDLPNLPVFTPSNFTKESCLLGSLNCIPPTKLNPFDTTSHSSLGTQQPAPVDPSIGVITSPIVKTTTPVGPPPSLRRQLDLINRFSPTGGAVCSICVADDGMLWVGTRGRLLLLINEKGEEQKRVDMAGEPVCTCVTRSGGVLVSTGGQSIYKVTRQGQVSTFVDVSPGRVYGITATQDGDVFASVYMSGSVCRVKKFTSEGKFVLELDSAMFATRHQFFAHAVSGDTVCIQDGRPDHDVVCCLVTLTTAGQVVSRVTRTGKLREHTWAIVWDKYGNMLTGTWGGEYIHVFSGEGACKQSYKVEGSTWVYTLCLGKDDVVWIGTAEGEVIRAKYLQ